MSGEEGDSPRQPRSYRQTRVQLGSASEHSHGPYLSATKRSLRDSLIIQRKAQSWPLDAIAEEACITERQVRRVLAERAEVGGSLLDQDAVEVIKDMMSAFHSSIGDFEVMAAAFAETHPSAAVGAKKAAMDTREKLLVLLQATGRLPGDLGYLGNLIDLRTIVEGTLDAMDEFEAGTKTVAEVRQRFNQLTGLAKAPDYPPQDDQRGASADF